MELKKYKLGELIDVTRGASLSGEFYATEGEYVRLTCGNFDYRNNCFKENKSKDNIYYTGSFREEFLMEEGDIITPLTEQAIGLLGSTAFIPEGGKYIQSQDVAKIICNEELLDKKFAFYLISSSLVKQQLSAAAQQTKIRHTSPDKIKDCVVWIPELAEQKRIGQLLYSLDQKIAINRQINDNLEAMAKQLYDYWFVQFDFPDEEGKPYKSSGGKMVWNDKLKREIPEDWEVLLVGDILDKVQNTPRLATNEYMTNGQYPIIDQTANIYYAGFTDREDAVSRQFPAVVFGDHSCAVKYVNFPFVRGADGTQIMLSKDDRISIEYLYFATKNIPLREGYARHYSILKESYIIAPTIYIAKLYQKLSVKQFELITSNRKEIIELTKQRDELLPLLMNGQVSVNYHLSKSYMRQFVYSYYHSLKNTMKQKFIHSVLQELSKVLDSQQLDFVENTLEQKLLDLDVIEQVTNEELVNQENEELLTAFLSAKKIEGCSAKTIKYYKSTIDHLFDEIGKTTAEITTNDIRSYLAYYQEQKQSSKVTIDNMRRIFSSFFSWLEDEDYIVKSPVRRIHKVRTDTLVKEVINDECMELLRDNCTEIRDLAMIDLLASTGMRVGELVQMNIDDVDFQERQCKVFGKGNKEREVYFNARAKIHLQQYISQRKDDNPALFVSFSSPHKRLSISGVEVRLRTLGRRINLPKIHPHKFRRTLATMAIDKGMPIEQVQRLLGHVKIDTTLHYAMVNQNNVKIAHRRYIG